MAAAIRGYGMILVMPENQSIERRQTMRAFGAELVLTPRRAAWSSPRRGRAPARRRARVILDQFANPDNPRPTSTAPARSSGSRPAARSPTLSAAWAPPAPSWACPPTSRAEPGGPDHRLPACRRRQIPGIRKWPEAYLPRIYDKARVDRLEYVSQADAEEMTRRLAREEGIFAGISSGGSMCVALRLAAELENAVIVSIVCDRGDRYLSTGVFPA